MAAIREIGIGGRSLADCFLLIKEGHPQWVLSTTRFATIFKEASRDQG